jgi:hypothetical protein
MAAAPRTRLAPCLNRRGVLALAATPLWPSCPHAADARLPPNAAALERIQSLRPNQSLRLGHAKVIGEFNATALEFGLDRTGPRARDFCRKMVWAPERRRALFAGANHGTPHRLNDVWEFDLAAMSWLLVYAPDLPRTYGGLGPDASDVEFRDGVLMTRRGGPAVIGHTWSGLTYDAEQRGMLFMNTWPINVDPLVKQVGGDPGQQYRGPPLWRFDAAARRWSVVKTPEPWPKAAVGALLEWVPELGGSVWHLNNWQLSASWLLDSGHGAWRVIADAKSSPGFADHAPGRELVGYHDPVRKRIVAQYRNDTFHFDTGTRRWARSVASGSVDGHDAHTGFYRHPATGLGLLVDFRDGRLHAYDPDQARWRTIKPDGEPMPSGPRVLAFIDQQLNVLAVIDDTEVWVYKPA